MSSTFRPEGEVNGGGIAYTQRVFPKTLLAPCVRASETLSSQASATYQQALGLEQTIEPKKQIEDFKLIKTFINVTLKVERN